MALELDLSDVRSVKGGKQSYQMTAEAFDFLMNGVAYHEPIVVELTVTHEDKFLSMKGHVSTVVEAICSRCLEPVVIPVESDVEEQLLYAKDVSLFSHLAFGEVEEEYFIYDNDTLDITDIIREIILAELPQKVLCRDDCRGLCPKCGKNLNQGDCGCDLVEIDPRLAILAKLNQVEEV